MTAVADKQVMDALKAKEAADKTQPHVDRVSMTLTTFFAPETCPSCGCAFEHSGSCAAMYCESCKSHFCLYCRTIMRGEGTTTRKQDFSTIAHNHVMDCEKKPPIDQILTNAVLFPVGNGATDGHFMDAFFKIRRLEMLQFQMQQGECTLCMSCRIFLVQPCIFSFQIGPLKIVGALCWTRTFRTCSRA